MAKIASAKPSSRPSHDEIARRAQAIYEQSGRQSGRDLENWLEAENQLMAGQQTEATPATNKIPNQIENRMRPR